jgi:hypothetical protein
VGQLNYHGFYSFNPQAIAIGREINPETQSEREKTEARGTQKLQYLWYKLTEIISKVILKQ